MDPFKIDMLGRWSYAFCVSLYLVLLAALLWYFRHTFRFAVWRFYMIVTVNLLLVLGFFFEWMAGVFFVWDFPVERHLFKLAVPFFGWFTGHSVPLEELVWIVAVVPLFYGDWRWNIENTFPAAYTFRGASLPFHEFFGYVTSATTFQALMFFLIRRFGGIVMKDASLVPFSRL